MSDIQIEAFGLVATIHHFDSRKLRAANTERHERLHALGWREGPHDVNKWVADLIERMQAEIQQHKESRRVPAAPTGAERDALKVIAALLGNPYGCAYCDSGKLREDCQHDEECPYLRGVNLLNLRARAING